MQMKRTIQNNIKLHSTSSETNRMHQKKIQRAQTNRGAKWTKTNRIQICVPNNVLLCIQGFWIFY